MSEDPARDGGNWYVYCSNNPVVFIDPTGLIIRVSTYKGKTLTKQFNQAKEYLINNSDTAKNLFKVLNNPDVKVDIEEGEEDNYFPYHWDKRIEWAPKKGLKIKDINKIISPSLALAHELGHRYLSLFDNKYQQWEKEYNIIEKELDKIINEYNAILFSKNPLNPNDDDNNKKMYELKEKMIGLAKKQVELKNNMEQKVLKEFERPIAEELNRAGKDEAQRTEYKGENEEYVPVADPTSTSISTKNSPTVICTELYRQELMEDWLYEADGKFGDYIIRNKPAVMTGYHFLAAPVVRQMKKSKEFTLFIYMFAKPWAYEMAYRVGTLKKGNFMGKVIMFIGLPFCEFVGNFILQKYSLLKFLLYLLLLIIFLVSVKKLLKQYFKNKNFLLSSNDKKANHKKVIVILLTTFLLFNCHNTSKNFSGKINFNELLLNNDLQITIYYRKFPSNVFHSFVAVNEISENSLFDYKVTINTNESIKCKELYDRFDDIELKNELVNTPFDTFLRCDFFTKKNVKIYSFALSNILNKNIVWVNGKYFKIEDHDYDIYSTLIELFMPIKYAFPTTDFNVILERKRLMDE